MTDHSYEVSTFTFNGLSFRAVARHNLPFFIGSDLLKFLFGSASGKGTAYGKLDPSEVTKVNRISLGLPAGKDMTLVTEAGLYKLVMRSDKKEAKDFQNWVTRVVLPAIRKDGGYIHGEEHVASGAMTEDELVPA